MELAVDCGGRVDSRSMQNKNTGTQLHPVELKADPNILVVG